MSPCVANQREIWAKGAAAVMSYIVLRGRVNVRWVAAYWEVRTAVASTP
ncbi:hypothetical protein P3T16_005613 [Paraburkholderia sp. GAS42]|jgi:hypothetical protein